MFDAAKLQKVLPLLSNYGKDVESWITDFSKTMELYDIMEPRRVFTWAKEAVEEDIQGVLNSLKTKKGNEIRYPKLNEIQDAIEKYMHITEGDKCAILKSLRINNGETVKKFNYRYKKLYHKLSIEYRRLISVKDYTTAISSRVFACSRVMTAECETLTEAFKIAEVAEEAEKEIISNSTPITNNIGTPIMITQNSINNNPLLQHPFYGDLQTRQQYINYNMNAYNNGRNEFRPSYKWNNRNNRRNLWNNSNNNNYNNYNHNINMNNNMYPNNTFNQYSNFTNNNNTIPNNSMYNNINNSNSNNNVKVMDKVINNRNVTDNNMQRDIPIRNNNNNMNNISNNNINNYQTQNNYKRVSSNNITNNGNINNEAIQNNMFSKNVNHLYCFRCTKAGHRASDCPYTFKQLADMEEKGLIKLPLNQ